jgi:hypothetical protein
MMDEVRAEIDEKAKKTWARLSLVLLSAAFLSVTFICM